MTHEAGFKDDSTDKNICSMLKCKCDEKDERRQRERTRGREGEKDKTII